MFSHNRRYIVSLLELSETNQCGYHEIVKIISIIYNNMSMNNQKPITVILFNNPSVSKYKYLVMIYSINIIFRHYKNINFTCLQYLGNHPNISMIHFKDTLSNIARFDLNLKNHVNILHFKK